MSSKQRVPPPNPARHALDGYLGLFAKAAAIATIIGSGLAAIINKLTFDEWNISYFQVATLGDLTIYTIKLSLDILFIIFISLFSVLVLFAFLIAARQARIISIRRLRLRGRLSKIANYLILYLTSAVLVSGIFAITLILFKGEEHILETSAGINILGSISVAFGLLVMPAILATYFRNFRRFTYIESSFALSVPLILMYSIYVFDPDHKRWFGYLSHDHTAHLSATIEGCDKVYAMWLGEQNTVLECWRESKKLEQILYIQDRLGGLIGPIKADERDYTAYSRYGPPPPPRDRVD